MAVDVLFFLRRINMVASSHIGHRMSISKITKAPRGFCWLTLIFSPFFHSLSDENRVSNQESCGAFAKIDFLVISMG